MEEIKYIKLTLGFLAVLAIVFVGAYFVGKLTKLNQNRLPSDGEDRDFTPEEKVRIQNLAKALYNDMEGVNIMGHENALYQELISMSDKFFVAVTNDFNFYIASINKNKESKTLREWIEGESPYSDSSFKGLRAAILTRFQRLNID